MFRRPLLILALAAAACTTVHAQSTPAKKDAVARILKVQQAGMDGLARDLLAEPAEKLLQQAGHAIARLPADKQEAAARDVQADARKFVDDNASLAEFASKLEKVCVDTVEAGFMTKDLALLVGADQRWLSTTGFLDKVADNLTKAMAK